MDKIKILLLSVGSLVGKNILEIIGNARESFELVGTNTIEGFDTKNLLDVFYLCPLTNAKEYFQFLEKIILDSNPDLIIPCRDEEVVSLAKIAEANQDFHPKISILGSELAKNFLDKYQSSLLCEELGLPFAKTLLVKDYQIDRIDMPLICKPREGFASKGVKILYSPSQLEYFNDLGETYILQEYLSEDTSILENALSFEEIGFPLHFSFEEDKYSIQLYISESIENSSFFIGKHQMKNGISHEVHKYLDPELEYLAKDCLKKFHNKGLRGPLNIQLQKNKNKKFRIFEFNCRFTGATSARYYLNYNELALLIKDKLGLSPFGITSNNFTKARKVIQTIGIE